MINKAFIKVLHDKDNPRLYINGFELLSINISIVLPEIGLILPLAQVIYSGGETIKSQEKPITKKQGK